MTALVALPLVGTGPLGVAVGVGVGIGACAASDICRSVIAESAVELSNLVMRVGEKLPTPPTSPPVRLGDQLSKTIRWPFLARPPKLPKFEPNEPRGNKFIKAAAAAGLIVEGLDQVSRTAVNFSAGLSKHTQTHRDDHKGSSKLTRVVIDPDDPYFLLADQLRRSVKLVDSPTALKIGNASDPVASTAPLVDTILASLPNGTFRQDEIQWIGGMVQSYYHKMRRLFHTGDWDGIIEEGNFPLILPQSGRIVSLARSTDRQASGLRSILLEGVPRTGKSHSALTAAHILLGRKDPVPKLLFLGPQATKLEPFAQRTESLFESIFSHTSGQRRGQVSMPELIHAVRASNKRVPVIFDEVISAHDRQLHLIYKLAREPNILPIVLVHPQVEERIPRLRQALSSIESQIQPLYTSPLSPALLHQHLRLILGDSLTRTLTDTLVNYEGQNPGLAWHGIVEGLSFTFPRGTPRSDPNYVARRLASYMEGELRQYERHVRTDECLRERATWGQPRSGFWSGFWIRDLQYSGLLQEFVGTKTRDLFLQKIRTVNGVDFSATRQEVQQLKPLIEGGFLSAVPAQGDMYNVRTEGEFFRIFVRSIIPSFPTERLRPR